MRQERMESRVSASDFSPLDEILESVSTEEVVSTVLTDKDLDEGSDEVFFRTRHRKENVKKENDQMWRLCPQ